MTSTALGLAASLSISTLLLVVVVGGLWWFDRRGTESLRALALAFLWGAVAAPLVSSTAWANIAGTLTGASGSSSVVLRLVVEEVVKGALLLLLAIRSSAFDSPTDGIVLGTATGLGFATTGSTGLAVAVARLGSGMAWIPVAMVAAVGGHALTTSMVGGSIGLARLSKRGRNRTLVMVGGLVAAVVVRWGLSWLRPGTGGLGDDPRMWAATVLAVFGSWLLVVVSCLAFERRIIDRELEEETSLAVVPPWVPQVIPYYRRRLRSNWWPVRSERIVLANLLTKLAFRKHVLDLLPPEEARLAGVEVVQLRARVRRFLSAQPPHDDS